MHHDKQKDQAKYSVDDGAALFAGEVLLHTVLNSTPAAWMTSPRISNLMRVKGRRGGPAIARPDRKSKQP